MKSDCYNVRKLYPNVSCRLTPRSSWLAVVGLVSSRSPPLLFRLALLSGAVNFLFGPRLVTAKCEEESCGEWSSLRNKEKHWRKPFRDRNTSVKQTGRNWLRTLGLKIHR
ncbi:uncharacterized protein dbx2 isoform X2 [Cetorhinus maximus]